MMNEAPASSERMMTPDVVITGEAVALEVSAASAGLRILSGLIDYILYSSGLVMSLITWSRLSSSDDESPSRAAMMVEASLILLLWVLLVPLTVETLSRGRSAGRLITGARGVRDDGGSIRLRHSLVRVLLTTVEIWMTLGVVASLACVATRRGKRLGDLLAGTYVVHERSAAGAAPPILMPPELAAWASQADLRALPGDLALVVHAARTASAPGDTAGGGGRALRGAAGSGGDSSGALPGGGAGRAQGPRVHARAAGQTSRPGVGSRHRRLETLRSSASGRGPCRSGTASRIRRTGTPSRTG